MEPIGRLRGQNAPPTRKPHWGFRVRLGFGAVTVFSTPDRATLRPLLPRKTTLTLNSPASTLDNPVRPWTRQPSTLRDHRRVQRQGFYPPDNPNNTAQPPLYYELQGCALNGNQFVPANQDAPVASAAVAGAFGVDGFVNVSNGAKKSRNYLPDLTVKQYSKETGPGVGLLTVPYKGLAGDLNPWNYNSSKPVHNPDSFDLWAEIDLGKRDNTGQKTPVIIGNWRQ